MKKIIGGTKGYQKVNISKGDGELGHKGGGLANTSKGNEKPKSHATKEKTYGKHKGGKK